MQGPTSEAVFTHLQSLWPPGQASLQDLRQACKRASAAPDDAGKPPGAAVSSPPAVPLAPPGCAAASSPPKPLCWPLRPLTPFCSSCRQACRSCRLA